MELNDILSAISAVGFPIVCCLIMFYLTNNVLAKMTDTINSLKSSFDTLNNEIKELRDDLKDLQREVK